MTEQVAVAQMQEVINLTPHDIYLQHADGTRTLFPFIRLKDADGNTVTKTIPATETAAERIEEVCDMSKVARVSQTKEDTGFGVAGGKVFRNVFGQVENLPDPRPGVIFIVSGLVLSKVPAGTRNDLVAPGEMVFENKVPVATKNWIC